MRSYFNKHSYEHFNSYLYDISHLTILSFSRILRIFSYIRDTLKAENYTVCSSQLLSIST